MKRYHGTCMAWAAAGLLLLWGCSTPNNGGKSSGNGSGTGNTSPGNTTSDATSEDGGTTTNPGDDAEGTGGTGTTDATGNTNTCDPACVAPEVCIDNACQLPQLCEPGTWVCSGLVGKKQCNDLGTGWLEPESCPGDQYCTSGSCALKCSLDPKWGAYVGCVFWTVDTPLWDDPTLPLAKTLPHAVVISNPNELKATVAFTPPPGVIFDFDNLEIAGGQSEIYKFPSLDTSGSNIYDLGIRIESNRPVLVHQFNPWDNTFSNDASLLLPEPLLGQEYFILSWPTDARGLIDIPIPGLENFGGDNVHGFVTIVAPHDNTTVTVRSTARVAPTLPPKGMEEGFMPLVKAMPPGGIQSFTLQKGQVLNLDAMPETIFEVADLTGTYVFSNKPIAVFAGHDSAAISAPKDPAPFPDPDEEDGGCCLDHLEEQMIPVGLLGNTYVAAKAADRGGENDLWRVVAADDNVTITTNPPIDGIHGKTLAKAGMWVEAFTTESFEIQATGRLTVGQYLVAQDDTNSGTGDPSMILAIPIERWRSTYPVNVPPKYNKNYVTIMRKPGTLVGVNGFPIPDNQFEPLAGGAWERAWVEVTVGFHTVSGDEPFGLSAYGYNSAVSYGYPGGMTIPGEANP